MRINSTDKKIAHYLTDKIGTPILIPELAMYLSRDVGHITTLMKALEAQQLAKVTATNNGYIVVALAPIPEDALQAYRAECIERTKKNKAELKLQLQEKATLAPAETPEQPELFNSDIEVLKDYVNRVLIATEQLTKANVQLAAWLCKNR